MTFKYQSGCPRITNRFFYFHPFCTESSLLQIRHAIERNFLYEKRHLPDSGSSAGHYCYIIIFLCKLNSLLHFLSKFECKGIIISINNRNFPVEPNSGKIYKRISDLRLLHQRLVLISRLNYWWDKRIFVPRTKSNNILVYACMV